MSSKADRIVVTIVPHGSTERDFELLIIIVAILCSQRNKDIIASNFSWLYTKRITGGCRQGPTTIREALKIEMDGMINKLSVGNENSNRMITTYAWI